MKTTEFCNRTGKALIALALATSLSLSACTSGSENDSSTTDDTITKAAYEAKITYYEAQLQNLSNQLTEMDQQMYLIRAQYQSKTNELEKQLEKLQQSSAANTPQTNEPQQSTNTPSKDNPSADTTTTPSTETGETTNSTQASQNNILNQETHTSNFTYKETENGIVITKYTGTLTEVVVPAALDGKRVIGLADSAFAKSNVTSVTLPVTIEQLGWFTFYQCASLTSVTLPASIQTIGYASFDGCSSQLCLKVEKDSYAEKFAASFALRYTTD